MSGALTEPAYPWKSRDKLYADKLDAAFKQLQSQLDNQANQITLLQNQLEESNLGTAITVSWGGGTAVTNGPEELVGNAPYDFTIVNMDVNAGISGGSFQVSIFNNGLVMNGLNGVLVQSPFKKNFVAINNNVVKRGNELTMVVSNVIGYPTDAWICLNGTTNALPEQLIGVGQGNIRGQSSVLGIGTFGIGSASYGSSNGISIITYHGIGSAGGQGQAFGTSTANAQGVTLMIGASFGTIAGSCSVTGVGMTGAPVTEYRLGIDPLGLVPL